MIQYVLKRLVLMVVTLFGIMVLTFALTRLTPGDPAALKVQPGQSGTGQGNAAAFADLVELNRRNLGLDKPLLLNLRFTDREALAERALDDLFRDASYWRDDGERRLRRQGAIALGAALERLNSIGTAEERVPTRNGEPLVFRPAEERRATLTALLPTLAGEPSAAVRSREEYVAFLAEHEEAFRPGAHRGNGPPVRGGGRRERRADNRTCRRLCGSCADRVARN